MNAALQTRDLARLLSEAEATIEALLSGQIDAVVDSKSKTPVLLSKAQSALRESEERYRRIVETANEGICIIDARSKITFVNRRIGEMLGYSAEEMLGQPLLRFLPTATANKAIARIERAREGASEESEIGFTRKDGAAMWALLKTAPIRDSQGQYLGTLAMMTDWTRHRQDEEALRKSEEQYRQIVETTTDGIIKIDAATLVVFVNRRFAEMLGYEPHEMIGVTALAFMSPEAKAIALEAFRRRRRGERDAIDTTFRHRDGTDITVNIAGAPLFDEHGVFMGNLAVVRDFTEQKKLQSQLMVSDRMASMGTLAAGVAHEINNPLAAVIANLDFVADTVKRQGDAALVAASTEPLADAREAAERVRFIVRDLKMFSRTPSEEVRTLVDVTQTLESSLRMAWNEVRHRARVVKLFGPVPRVDANEARLGQVFLNLIMNAAQALPDGNADRNEIHLCTRLDGNRVLIEVSDTGSGIEPAVMGRIFDAFFTTKAVGVGTGLGLAICQRIVTDMGGQLTVTSELGQGSTFRVSLPVGCTEKTGVTARLESIPATGRRGRVLLVDDDKAVVRATARVLSREHEVDCVTKAAEALALIVSGEKYDVILCDLMMPEMSGMDLHRELSSIAPAQAERMIFITGGAFTPGARAFLSEVPKEHLEKPFDAANLRAIIQRHLR